MILDILENTHRYSPFGKSFEKAFEFLTRPDLKNLPVDRYEIDGERVYAMVVKDSGRSKDEAQLETHRDYIDIQLVLSGVDNMGWKPASACKHPAAEYDNGSDIHFFTDKPDVWLATGGGSFAVFFPEDAHMPMVSSGKLHKVVVKVAVD